jgi:hypothetical protein
MWETIAIILTLGGLELTLWLLERRADKRDHEMQQRQLEILDGILTELAIQNSEDIGTSESPELGSEMHHGRTRETTKDRAQEHTLCH